MAYFSRKFVDKYGYKMRHAVNRFVARYSSIPDVPVFDADQFDWTKATAPHWPELLAEFEAKSASDPTFRAISDLSSDHEGLDPDKKWHSAILYGYGVQHPDNCERYPKTAEIVGRIPGLITAMFSVFQPGARLPSHVGVTKGMLTCHLGLDIPDGDCAIKVEGEDYGWSAGNWFVFDDTRRHEAWNMTDKPRVILLCHVKRPMHGIGKVVQDIFFKGIVNSAFIQEFHANIVRYTEQKTELPPSDREADAPAEHIDA